MNRREISMSIKKTVTRIISILLCVLFLVGCGDNIPSKKKVVAKGPEWTENAIVSHTKDELTAKWGEPDEIIERDGSQLIVYTIKQGRIEITYDGQTLKDVQAWEDEGYLNRIPWPVSLLAVNDTMAVILGLFCTAFPFILLFVIVALIFKKLGWLNTGDRDESRNRRTR